MSRIGELITERRQARGYSGTRLAREVGIDRSYLSLLERGKRNPSPETVKRLAAALDVPEAEALCVAYIEQAGPLVAGTLPASPGDVLGLHRSARLLAERHAHFTVTRLIVTASVDDSGALRYLRTYQGCRPSRFTTEPVPFLQLKERSRGSVEPGPGDAQFRVYEAPPGLEHRVESGAVGVAQVHRIVFPGGWHPHEDPAKDTLSFSLLTKMEKAYVFDPLEPKANEREGDGAGLPRGSFSTCLIAPVGHLEISVSLPGWYVPARWGTRSWYGGSDTPTLYISDLAGHGVAKASTFTAAGSSATLTVEEPIDRHHYAVTWTPPHTRPTPPRRRG